MCKQTPSWPGARAAGARTTLARLLRTTALPESLTDESGIAPGAAPQRESDNHPLCVRARAALLGRRVQNLANRLQLSEAPLRQRVQPATAAARTT